MRDYPSKHVMVVKDDGEYSSASDFDKNTHAFLVVDHMGSEEQQEEHVLVLMMQSAMRDSLCNMCLVRKWRRHNKIRDILYYK